MIEDRECTCAKPVYSMTKARGHWWCRNCKRRIKEEKKPGSMTWAEFVQFVDEQLPHGNIPIEWIEVNFPYRENLDVVYVVEDQKLIIKDKI